MGDSSWKAKPIQEAKFLERECESSNLQEILLILRWLKQSHPDFNITEIVHVILSKIRENSVDKLYDDFGLQVSEISLKELTKFLNNIQKRNIIKAPSSQTKPMHS